MLKLNNTIYLIQNNIRMFDTFDMFPLIVGNSLLYKQKINESELNGMECNIFVFSFVQCA